MSPEAFEELYGLYTRANCEPLSVKEAVEAQQAFTETLQHVWNMEKLPFPFVYDDFRRTVMNGILDRLEKTDPHYRRPRF